MDWDEVTETWVAEGLIQTDQAPALRRWLHAHATSSSGPGDTALTVLAVAGAWLLTGASILLVSYLGGSAEEAGTIALISAMLWAIVGGVVGPRINPGIGVGLGAAAIVIAPVAIMALFEAGPAEFGPGMLLLTLTPAALGTGVAAYTRRTGLAVAASMAAATVLVPWVFDRGDAAALFLLAGTLVYLAGPNLLAYLARLEDDETRATIAATLQPQVAFATVIVLFAAFADAIFPQNLGYWWESGAKVTFAGFALLGLGALGQSRMTLLAGLVSLVVAEITFLTAFGDVVVAIVILGVEGLVLLVAAIAAVAARVSHRRRQAEAVGG